MNSNDTQNGLKKDEVFIPSESCHVDGIQYAYPRMVSVLLVFDNPAELDRLCRYLEKKGELMADLRVSDDDAIHLMQYVPFDVIVTEYPEGCQDRICLLRMMRNKAFRTPVIYFIRSRDAEIENEAQNYDPVFFLQRDNSNPANDSDQLYAYIMQVAGHEYAEPG